MNFPKFSESKGILKIGRSEVCVWGGGLECRTLKSRLPVYWFIFLLFFISVIILTVGTQLLSPYTTLPLKAPSLTFTFYKEFPFSFRCRPHKIMNPQSLKFFGVNAKSADPNHLGQGLTPKMCIINCTDPKNLRVNFYIVKCPLVRWFGSVFDETLMKYNVDTSQPMVCDIALTQINLQSLP